MKKYLLLTSVMFFVFAGSALAANTTGNAWSESVGWFDFSNAEVSSSAITGHAYNDNTGWLVLDGVTNTNGILSGYAWSESVGYFDFSDVTISSGSFAGYAYNDNTGWLSFEDGTNVTTTWAPSRTSSGSSSQSRIQNLSDMGKTTEVEKETNETTNAPSEQTLSSPSSNNARNLKAGDTGPDVKIVQILLNHLGYIVTDKGLGSPGNETDYFGEKTRQAIIKFQLANNINPPVGYFGPVTRDAFIQKLIASLLTTNN